MNEEQRQELRDIRVEQRFLAARLAALDRRLTQAEAADRLEASPPPPMAVPAPPRQAFPQGAPAPPAPAAPVLPPPLPPLPQPPPKVAPAPAFAKEPAPAFNPPISTGKAESLEMRIGTTWLVRVGIVLLLTSFAFLGSYLYKNIVPHLGPGAKVALLYAGAGVVTAVGAWLERSRQGLASGRVRNYARIVFAGGLAAVYYVTYVAHYYEKLRVIDSQLAAGALLLGWASLMVWLAERRGSETLATVAILLAYYTSAINEGVAGFTLASNLFLTAGAVFLLRRHLWRVFPFASLAATFGSYAFWNYFHSYLGWRGLDRPPVHRGGGQVWVEGAFLLTYWALFTWAAFTAREDSLPRARRAGFVSLNNGAFFLLTTWLLLGENPHNFWKWSLGFGALLVALSEAARRLPRRLDANTEAAYLLQGILLVTLGFVTYFSGWQLSLVLAAQSVALLAAGGQRRSRLMLGAAYGAGFLSFVCALTRLTELGIAPNGLRGSNRAVPSATGLAEGGFLVLAAWWGERLRARERAAATGTDTTGNNAFQAALALAPAYFSLLGLAVWLWLLERGITAEIWAAPALALIAVALTASIYVLRIRAIPVFAQAYLLAAYVRWVAHYGGLAVGSAPPWWNPAILLSATLALGHWWQRKETRKIVADMPWERTFALPGAMAVVLLLHLWLRPLTGGDNVWIGEAALLSVGLLAYGMIAGYRTLAAAGQWFLLVSAGMFLWNWRAYGGEGYRPQMWLTLGCWLAPLLTAVAARRLAPPDDRARLDPGGEFATVYQAAAMGLFIAWAGRNFPRETLFALFCAVGAGVFALGIGQRERRWMLLSAAPTATGLIIFALAGLAGDLRHPAHLIGVASLGAEQWWGRRQLREDEARWFPRPAQNALMVATTFCAWWLVTAWMAPWGRGAFTLAAAWSIFAAGVFAAGLALREPLYRWLSLLVLAITLGRIAVIDIWRLSSLERTVSMACLSLILIGLGYLYNRYYDKWKNLL